MTKKSSAKVRQTPDAAPEPSLDSRYGEIGISAVAAALPYQSTCKNPAYAPSLRRRDQWTAEMAA